MGDEGGPGSGGTGSVVGVCSGGLWPPRDLNVEGSSNFKGICLASYIFWF